MHVYVYTYVCVCIYYTYPGTNEGGTQFHFHVLRHAIASCGARYVITHTHTRREGEPHIYSI